MVPVAIILCAIYNRLPKKNAEGYYTINLPFGMEARFIPSAADKWDVTPMASRQHDIKRGWENQRAFLVNTRATAIQGILELDYPITLPDDFAVPPKIN